MNCEAIRKLLEYEDVDARIDHELVDEHLQECEICGSRYSEVLGLFSLLECLSPKPIPRRFGRRTVMIVAAAALILAVGLAVCWLEFGKDAVSKKTLRSPAATAADVLMRPMPVSMGRIFSSIKSPQSRHTFGSELRKESWSPPPARRFRRIP
jgi:hypothetical protein